ncbi:MAG: hypothetical protein HYX92_01490 [Chloroflexi bacterium]|nr:hypothetical protein [Chloroflexota bacterium]
MKPLALESVKDFNGNDVDVAVFLVDVEIMGLNFPGTEVIGVNSLRGFVGRDLLNSFVATLDGPQRVTRCTIE